MAEKRMFAKTIIDSDAFLDMPTSAQALYFHLCMRADDEGFINSVNKIQRMIGASKKDLEELTERKFIIMFDSGIAVVKHWFVHNTLKGDRRKPTVYAEEASRLSMKDNRAYTLEPNWNQSGTKMEQERNQNGTKVEPQYSIDKISIDKISIEESNARTRGGSRFAPPTLQEVQSYSSEKGYHIDCQGFIDYYESNGWKVGRNPMKDWKAAVRRWASRDKHERTNSKPAPERPEGWEDLDKIF